MAVTWTVPAEEVGEERPVHERCEQGVVHKHGAVHDAKERTTIEITN